MSMWTVGLVILGILILAGVIEHIRDRTLERRTLKLLESGAEPSAIVEWYDRLFSRPAKYREPARRQIRESPLPNAQAAQKIITTRRDSEERLSVQYGSIFVSPRAERFKWPAICARCGVDLAPTAAFTATPEFTVENSIRKVSLKFPVCAADGCAIDQETTLQRPRPSYGPPNPLEKIGGGVAAHKRFLDAAKALNPGVLS